MVAALENGVSSDQRHHRPAGVSAGYLGGLGMVGGVMGLHPPLAWIMIPAGLKEIDKMIQEIEKGAKG